MGQKAHLRRKVPDLTRQIAITGHVAVPIVHDAGPNLFTRIIKQQMFFCFSSYLLV